MSLLCPPNTNRIAWRKIVPADLNDLVALDSDPEVMRHINGGQPTPRAEYLGEHGVLARMCAFEDQSLGFFSARVEGSFAGWFHLRPSVFDPEVPELGYRLAQPYWGQGLATEGSLALCRWAFGELDASAVDACAVKENTGSIRVMKKCGMSHQGAKSHPRAEVDVEHYLVSSAEWIRLIGQE